MSSIYRNGRLYGGSESHLDGLDDVTITSPAEGELLQRNGNGDWVNSAVIPQKVAGLQETGCVNTLETTMIDHVISGITFTVTKDGISTVGTNASSQYDVGELVGNYTPPVSGTYKLLGCPSDGSTTTYWLEIIDNTAGGNLGSDTGNGFIVTLDATHSYRVRIKIGKSLLAPSGMWKPMVTGDLSATYADYQPYAMTNRELTEGLKRISIIRVRYTNDEDYTFGANQLRELPLKRDTTINLSGYTAVGFTYIDSGLGKLVPVFINGGSTGSIINIDLLNASGDTQTLLTGNCKLDVSYIKI